MYSTPAKRLLYLIVFTFYFYNNNATAQLKITDTVYYNNKWQMCEKPIAFYYRVGILAVLDDKWYFLGPFRDYDIKGTLLTEGNYSAEGLREGIFKFYYPDGKPRLLATYIRGLANGDWHWYYHDGNLKAIVNFPDESQDFRFVRFIDENGVATLDNGTGTFTWPTLDFESASSHYKATGSFKFGIRDGDWNFTPVNSWIENPVTYKEIYKDGKRTKTVMDVRGGGTAKVNLPATIFSFSPQHLYTAEAMQYDVLFSINGDSLAFNNLATYLIEDKPAEMNLKYIVFDTAFKRVLKRLERFIDSRMIMRTDSDIDCLIGFKIGSKGRFEDISFTGIGVDSLTKKYVEFFLSKFSDLEMPGDFTVGFEQNFKIYLYVIDLEEWLPSSMSRGITKRLFLSFLSREKMLKYLNDNKKEIKSGLIDALLNNENYYYRRKN